jgi:hypothetical protein
MILDNTIMETGRRIIHGLVVYSMDKFNEASDICGVDFDYKGIGVTLAEMILEQIESGRNMKSRLFPGTFADERKNRAKLKSLEQQ